MKTRRSLKADEPLLVGRIDIINQFSKSTPPSLSLDVWCPYCKRHHHHGWGSPDKIHFAAVEHRAAHCHTDSPFTKGGYWIALDPAAKVEIKATFERFRLLASDREKRLARV